MDNSAHSYTLNRVKLIQKELIDRGSDAFVIYNDEDSNWESLFYLSGFRGTAGALLVYPHYDAELILDGRYKTQGKEQSPHKIIGQNASLVSEINSRLALHNAKNVFIENHKTSHDIWMNIANRFTLNEGAEIINKLRRKKDKFEISMIKKSAEIAAKAFLETLNHAKAGMNETEFEALLNYNIRLLGGGIGFDMIVASGMRSAMPHGRATEKKFISGEWVTVDFGARYNNYFCDITRNFSIGAPSDEALNMHDLILNAHKTAAAMLRKGANGTEIHNKAAEVFAAQGKAGYFIHGLGHSFGLEIHESPRLARSKTDILEEGDIVTVEPGLYFPCVGGMRIEDDYLITADGALRLTQELNQSFYTV